MLCEAKCTVLHFAIFEIQKKSKRKRARENEKEKMKKNKNKKILLVEFL